MNDFFDARVRTGDMTETLAWLHAEYGQVDVLAERASIAERASGDETFALRHLEWDCRAEVVYDCDRFFFATSAAGLRWRVGTSEGDFSVDPGIVQPGQQFVGRPDVTDVHLIAFDADWFTEAARTIYGDDELDVRFDGIAPVSRRLRDYWVQTVRWSFTQLPLLSEPLVRAHVRRALVAATLEAFPLVGDPRERRASALEQAAIYADATSWIDDHASLPVTVDDAARAVGTSARGLRRAFAANGHLAVSPEEYLGLARVSAAHADLVGADPAVTTVAAVAARWGFIDIGAFVAAYREEYGVHPRTTLAR